MKNIKNILLTAMIVTLNTPIIAMQKPNDLKSLGYEKVEIKDLNTFDYKAASVLPRFNGMVAIGRESKGRSKGLYADFGGFKSRTQPETPSKTAARELWEESAGLLGTEKELENYINPASKNTENIIASVPLKHAMFITDFDKNQIENFASSFFEKTKEIAEKEKKEKDELAFVRWNELYEKIKNTPRDEKGYVKDVPLKAAIVYDANGKRTNVDIIVRAGLVAVLYPFFNDTNTKNQSNKIFLYNPLPVKP